MKAPRQFRPVFAALLLAPLLQAEEGGRAEAFAREALARVEEKPSVRGDAPDWFFLVRELRHLATGAFWEAEWSEVATNATDPVPSLVEFHQLLEDRGVKLILAPVPAKGRLYPGKLDDDFDASDPGSLTPFITQLQDRGLDVIDLDTLFRSRLREFPDVKLYCEQDAHFSPAAIELLADEIASRISMEPESRSDLAKLEARSISITGDQVSGSEWEGAVPAEILSIRSIESGGESGVEPDPDSPFLLLGDSHTLVFHQGKESGMHCRGAGLVDELSYRFGRAFDLVGVRGSGMVQARKQLYYRAASEPGFWERKRLVVWVFSEREFTQSTDRLMSIPLDPE